MARFIVKITEAESIPEGDSRYLSKELLSTLPHIVPDLKKADIFSLGITAYELLTLDELPKNGSEWQALRNGSFEYPEHTKRNYSQELLDTVRKMIDENTELRPSADQLLMKEFASDE